MEGLVFVLHDSRLSKQLGPAHATQRVVSKVARDCIDFVFDEIPQGIISNFWRIIHE